jgi:hypothetical protein
MNSQITVNRTRNKHNKIFIYSNYIRNPSSGIWSSRISPLLQNHALTGVTSLDVYLRKWERSQIWELDADLRIERRLETVRRSESYIYMADWDPIIKRGWEPIHRFNPRHIFVPVQSQDLDFQRHMLWSPVLCSVHRGEGWLLVLLILVELFTITVCLVDIGGIVDHHCLFCWYWWNCWPSLFVLLILVELLTITVCLVDIGGIVDHHCLFCW